MYLLFNLWLKPTLRAEPPFDFFSLEEKLGTGHYLSIGGGGGGFFGGDHLMFRRTKGGISRN